MTSKQTAIVDKCVYKYIRDSLTNQVTDLAPSTPTAANTVVGRPCGTMTTSALLPCVQCFDATQNTALPVAGHK